jgi:hypothetical protein
LGAIFTCDPYVKGIAGWQRSMFGIQKCKINEWISIIREKEKIRRELNEL